MRKNSGVDATKKRADKLKQLLEAAQDDPIDPSIKMDLAYYYKESGKHQEAAKYALEAVKNGIGDQGIDFLIEIIEYFLQQGFERSARHYADKLYNVSGNNTAKKFVECVSGMDQAAEPKHPKQKRKQRKLKKSKSSKKYRAGKITKDQRTGDVGNTISSLKRYIANNADGIALNKTDSIKSKRLFVQAENCYQESNYTEALNVLDQRGLLVQDQAGGLLRARIYYERKDYYAAKVVLEACLKISNNSACYSLLCQVLYRLGQFQTLVEVSKQWLDDQPTSNKAYLYQAEALRRLNKYEEAIAQLQYAETWSEQRFLCQAYCHMHLKQWAQALRSFDQALVKFANKGENIQTNDSRLRMCNGYVFLYDYMDREPGTSPDLLEVALKRAQKAALWIRSRRPEHIGDMQEFDYKAAMDIISQREELMLLTVQTNEDL